MSGSNNQTIGQFQPASNVQPTDLIAGWQAGLKPSTRSMTVQQIIDQVSGSFMPLTGGTLIGPGNLTVNGPLIVSNTSTLNGDTSVGGDTTLSGALTVAGASTLSGLMTAPSVAISGGNIDGTIIGNTSRAAAFVTTLNANSTANITGITTIGVSGAVTQLIPASPSGNFTIKLGTTAGFFQINSSAGTNLMQIGGAVNTIGLQQQVLLRAQGGANPVWSGAARTTLVPFFTNNTWTGTSTADYTPLIMDLHVTSGVDARTNGVRGITLQVNNETGHAGNIQGLTVATNQNVQNTDLVNASLYVGIYSQVAMFANDGGTAGVITNYKGACTAFNPVTVFQSGATYVHGGGAIEADVETNAGAIIAIRAGISIISSGPVQGDYEDRAFCFATVNSLNDAGWKSLIQIGQTLANSNPMDQVNGQILTFYNNAGASTIVAKGGFDFTNFAPTTHYMTAPGLFNLDQNGNWQAASYGIGSAGPTWTSGSGVPSATQPKGSFYTRTGGSAGSTFYVSQGGGTWNAVASV